MRKCLALFCALALFAWPIFFTYLDAESVLRRPDAVYGYFDPWLPLVTILCSLTITLALPWIVGLLCPKEQQE